MVHQRLLFSLQKYIFTEIDWITEKRLNGKKWFLYIFPHNAAINLATDRGYRQLCCSSEWMLDDLALKALISSSDYASGIPGSQAPWGKGGAEPFLKHISRRGLGVGDCVYSLHCQPFHSQLCSHFSLWQHNENECASLPVYYMTSHTINLNKMS